MSQILDEQLSAFLDGELAPEEVDLVLARLDREPALRARFGRYGLIGECLRSGSARPEALLIAEGVRSALEKETAGVAPVLRPVSGRLPRRWLAAGLAAAAAVLAIVVVNVPLPLPITEAQRFSSTAPGAEAVVGSDDINVVRAAVSLRPDPRSAARLTTYLVAHGTYASPLSRSTFDSHLVTARPERASWRQAQDPANAR